MLLLYEFKLWSNLYNRPNKICKIKIQSNINFPRVKKWRIWIITINNFFNTNIFHISYEERDGKFIFKGKFLSRLQKNVKPSYEWVLKNFKYQDPKFMLDYLMS